MSTYRVYAPCPGPITGEFGDVVYNDEGRNVYEGNGWGYHLGLDLGVDVGTPIVAVRTGRCIWSGFYGQLGYCVILHHADRSRSLYAHLDTAYPVVGQRVRGGRRLGLSGATGETYGAHLHVELWLNATGDGDDPVNMTRTDPTALPADPWPVVKERRWPTVGMHMPGFDIPVG